MTVRVRTSVRRRADRIGPRRPRTGLALKGLFAGRQCSVAETLRGRLDIREVYEGLEITSTSFVGRVGVGPLRIAITPKLPAMPLARLLRYA